MKNLLILLSLALMCQPTAHAYDSDAETHANNVLGHAISTNHPTQGVDQQLEVLPFVFETNQGQYHSSVKYLYRGTEYTIGILANGFILNPLSVAHGKAVSVHFVGANPNPLLQDTASTAKVNYFLSNDQSKWRRDIPLVSRVRVKDIYPGIDVVYYGHNGEIEFDFEIAPGANPALIRLAVDGASTELAHADHRMAENTIRKAVLRIPWAYQEIDGSRSDVEASLVLKSGLYQLKLGDYDKSRPLVVDPVLSFSTYLGGNAADESSAMAVDVLGNVYMALYTNSTNLPTLNAYQNGLGGFASIYVAKFIRQGNQLVLAYATYIGNNLAEVRGLAVDGLGNAYITGSTSSTTFPLVNPLQVSNAGLIDGYVVKLGASGNSLLYSTYFGGNSVDRGRAIAVDALGNAYITGVTSSTNFPVQNAYQSTNAGILDCYVLKLVPAGNTLVFSTYLGGSDMDYGAGIVIDNQQNVYISGNTYSPNFPAIFAFQTAAGGASDGFVAKLNPTGTVLFSTYLGGNGDDFAPAITLDAAKNIYVAGQTGSANFPSLNTTHATYTGTTDAFVTRFTPSGIANYSRYLGGTGSDAASAITIDTTGHPYLSGSTTSIDFPMALPLRGSISGAGDAFISVLDIPSDSQIFSTYIGGTGTDYATSIKLDASENIILGGYTTSNDLPLVYPYQSVAGGGNDAYFMIISADSDKDGAKDWSDNCLTRYNPDQKDTNANGVGNACEPPVMSGFWPGSGPPNTFVFIFGSYFTSDSQVYVNGVRAPNVQFVDANTLIFMLPGGNTFGPVSVITPNGSATSSTSFDAPLSGLQISGIWPGTGPVGTFEFVFGSGFVLNQSSVSVGDTAAGAVQVVDDQLLIFIVPNMATSGAIRVTTPAGNALSPVNFIVQ